ncbi:MAG: redoxin family protein, partial [Pseudohongiellaceae bacterium]
ALARLLMPCVLALGSLTLAAGASADDDGWLRSLPDFKLTDQLGETHNLAGYKQYDYAVFYVQGVGCPIARISVPSYREVRDLYAGHNIAFTMFNANIQDDLPRIAKEAEEFGIDFPIMKDEGQHLAKALGVERTAEVFVVDMDTQEVLFRGPINDKLGYETQRNEANEEYLKDALDTLLAGGTVNMDEVPDSKGCLVAIF